MAYGKVSAVNQSKNGIQFGNGQEFGNMQNQNRPDLNNGNEELLEE